MHGSERREQIIRQIQESKAPVSGTKLASFYNVSRQVIVQDIYKPRLYIESANDSVPDI